MNVRTGAWLGALAMALIAGCRGDGGGVAAAETEPSRCGAGMTEFRAEGGPLCIHTHEVQLVSSDPEVAVETLALHSPEQVLLVSDAGRIPTKTTWFRADALCKAHGMWLCTSQQWEDACDGMPGPGGTVFPTPDGTYRQGQCNFTDVMGAPRQPLAPTGSYPDCVNAKGLYDMAGNLWEWSDPGIRGGDGLPQIDKRGGAHYGREAVGCAYQSVGSHPPSFEGTIGFRCCGPVLER